MLKLLFILPSLQPGGAERVTITILQKLDKKKFSSTLFLIRRGGELSKDVPPWVKVVTALNSKQNIFIFFPYLIFKLLITAFNKDVFFGCLELTSTYLAFLLGKLFNRPALGWVHINLQNHFLPFNFFHRNLSKIIYPKLKKIIAVSKGVSDSILLRFQNIKPSKIEIINNPIFREYILQKSCEPVSSELFQKPTIIGVGRLSARKRFDILIRAHYSLVSQGLDHNLLILGDGDDWYSLKKLVESLDLENSVRFLGFQENPYKFMKFSKVFVLCSDFEGLPTVILEAMTLGIPVIATDCPNGPKEILMEGKYGILVPPNNHEIIASGIRDILLDKQLGNKLSLLGKERAKQFEAGLIVPIFEDTFRKAAFGFFHS